MIQLDRHKLRGLRENHPQIVFARNHAYENVDHRTGTIGDEKIYLLIMLRGLLNQYYELTRGPLDTKVLALPTLQVLLKNIQDVLYFALGDDQTTIAHLLNAGFIQSEADVFRLLAGDPPEREKDKSLGIPLIGVTGKIASGKETVGKLLAARLQYPQIALSDRLREVALSRVSAGTVGLPFERDMLRKINDVFKPNCGNEVFVRWTLWQLIRMMSHVNMPGAVVDGFRSVEEALYFIAQGGNIIYVDATIDTRFERSTARARTAGDLDRASFEESDRVESNWIEPIRSLARVIIGNDGTLDELRNAVHSMRL